jgi:uncharacterized membrane protein YedE/YeeE
MLPLIMSFVGGVIFALGLVISGMTQPSKVIAFLDIAGNWDFRLALVMAGGIAVHGATRLLILKRGRPVFAESFPKFSLSRVDAPLVVGSAVFGVGWGLGGMCPGPALTSLVSGAGQVLVFVVAMFGGMYLVKWVQARQDASGPTPAQPAPDGASLTAGAGPKP